MKSLAFAAGIAALALPLSAAQAGIITIGEGFARSCYEASERQDARPVNIETCNRAFSEQALDIHDQVATHVNRGILYYLSGNLAAANYDYNQALALKTVRPALAYYGRAIVNEDFGNVRQAYADLQRARDLEPRWPLPAEELKRYVVRE